MRILSKGEYFGKKKLELSFNGIVLSEYSYHEPKTVWHYHENPYFMYVLHGNMYDFNKKQKTACPSGSILYNNWQETHYNSKESELGRGFHLEFERDWFEQKKIDVSLWEGSKLLENPKIHHIFGKIYYEFITQDHYSKASIELLLLQLCETIGNSEEKTTLNIPNWIEPLKELLHYSTENIDLDYLSKQLNIHPVHLSRSIPKYLSCSLGEYIRQQKIKQSLNYLIDSEYSLTEITYLCGFSDQSHFTRLFKQYFKNTPSAYRKYLKKSQ
ncbi:AraC-like DNA-binding protein [Saonia flava]|uniref:AraC-like DNA-binding protein n=1 Tax=Saonia flava TaxID=523696 RepID=A0A846QV32_9FLAO|nr:helix-turn-helix transcriptional regulator [Saonia flava]NJB72121.1 AraC-like DNA-binding protein [Saonia flava]